MDAHRRVRREAQGRATLQTAEPGAWRPAETSEAVPGLRRRDLEDVLNEPGDVDRTRRAEALAERLAPAVARHRRPQAGRSR